MYTAPKKREWNPEAAVRPHKSEFRQNFGTSGTSGVDASDRGAAAGGLMTDDG